MPIPLSYAYSSAYADAIYADTYASLFMLVLVHTFLLKLLPELTCYTSAISLLMSIAHAPMFVHLFMHSATLMLIQLLMFLLDFLMLLSCLYTFRLCLYPFLLKLLLSLELVPLPQFMFMFLLMLMHVPCLCLCDSPAFTHLSLCSAFAFPCAYVAYAFADIFCMSAYA